VLLGASVAYSASGSSCPTDATNRCIFLLAQAPLVSLKGIYIEAEFDLRAGDLPLPNVGQ